MALANRVLDSFFNRVEPPATLEVGLSLRGSEVTAEGYERQPVRRGDWTVTSNRAESTVEFGTFGQPVEFDAVFLAEGTEVLRTIPKDGEIRLLAGMTHVEELSVTLADL